MTERSAQISGRVELDLVMATLAERRRVFHSEADLQFAFAQVLSGLDSEIAVRLEVRRPGTAEFVDLVCAADGRRTFIEFKYATARWSGPDAGEDFVLREHAAYDLARRYFVHDVSRLERFVGSYPTEDGIAILLTNEPGLWLPPRRHTRDAAFRLHEGRELAGRLVWGTGDTPRYDSELRGAYAARWSDYSDLGGAKGRFRWLAIPVVTATPRAETP